MKLNKLILISIFLLAIISLSAASAADDDLNTEIEGQNADDGTLQAVSEDITQDTKTDDDTSVLSTEGGDIQTAPQTIVITNETVTTYFGADGKLVDTVEEGSTLDFQGTITSDNIKTMYINKKVNIVSSNGNGVIYLNTSSGAEITTGDLTNRFILDANASGTVLSGVTFYNTQLLLLDNIHDITMDGINVIAEDISMATSTSSSSVMGKTGVVQILASENITVKNSNFYANNVNASLFCAYTMPINYEIYNNNFTARAVRYIIEMTNSQPTKKTVYMYNTHFTGNQLYVNLPINSQVENIDGDIVLSSLSNFNIKNSNLYGFVHNGNNHTVVNCTFEDFSSPGDGLYLYDSNITTFSLWGKESIIDNCNIKTITNPGGSGQHLINNSVINSITIQNINNGNVIINNNTITEFVRFNTRYSTIQLTNNNITGYVTIGYSKAGSNIEGNTIHSPHDYAITATRAANYNVVNNYLFAKKSYGDASVSGTFTTVANNSPTQTDLSVSATNIIYFNESKIVVNIPSVTSGNITLVINSKEISVPIVGEFANYNLTESYYHAGVNEIEAFYADAANEIYGYNSTTFTVEKVSDYALEIKSENATEGIKTTINLVLTNNSFGLAMITLDNGEYLLSFSKNITNGDNIIDIPGLLEGNYNITVDFSSYAYSSRIVTSTITFNKAITPTPTPSPAPQPVKEIPTLKATKKTVTIKKSAKKLVLRANLKINGKAKKGLKVKFTLNKKTRTGKTDAKGNVKVTFKKADLKKLKAGKKYTVTIKYAKKNRKN